MLQVKTDHVYLKMCERFGRKPDVNLFHDPYHRYIRILDHLVKNNMIKQGDRCLDLGCLRPELASLLINNFNANVTGIDQWDMLEYWTEMKMKYFNCNLATDFTTLFDEPFDIVFALEILEHMIDTDLFLDRLYKSVKKDGLLVISTPNINNFRNRVTVPFGAYPQPLEYWNNIHHVRLYNVPIIKMHLNQHGFDVLKIFGVNFLPYRGPMKNKMYRSVSEALGTAFPSLCMNMVIIAKPR